MIAAQAESFFMMMFRCTSASARLVSNADVSISRSPVVLSAACRAWSATSANRRASCRQQVGDRVVVLLGAAGPPRWPARR